MRALALASLSLVIGSFTLVGCNHGTNVPPLHRPRPVQTQTPTTTTEEAKPTKIPQPTAAPAQVPEAPAAKTQPEAQESIVKPIKVKPVEEVTPEETQPTPAAPPAPAPVAMRAFGITQGPWCNLTLVNDGYLVTRWTFTSGADTLMTNDQLKITKDQPTRQTMISTGSRWEEVNSEQRTPARARTGAEVIQPGVIHAQPAYDQQNDLMLELLASNGNVDSSEAAEIGLRGGLRITNHDPLRSHPEIVAFPCADYSPDFVRVGAPATPPAAKTTVPAPGPTKPEAQAKPEPTPKADPFKLTAPFTPFDIKTAALEGSRWCSWTKTEKDTLIGVLQFHAEQKMSLTQFFKAKLTADVLDTLGLLLAVRGGVETMSITGTTGPRFVTNTNRGFRLADDANETRVLIADDAGAPNAAPGPNATVFYPCVPSLIPGDTPLLMRNLKNYMDLRDKRARE